MFSLITVFSVYLPKDGNTTVAVIIQLSRSLPRPFIITIDFEAYNVMWGSQTTNSRGRIIEKYVDFVQGCSFLRRKGPQYARTLEENV